MSTNPTTQTTFALQDILLGVADSLNEAQQALRDVEPYDSFGRPNTVYQLPYLDFSLKVTSEFETSETTQSDQTPKKAIRFGAVREANTNSSTSSSNNNYIITSSFFHLKI